MTQVKKTLQVVMLPTNEKANKGDIIGNNKGFTITDMSLSLTELCWIQAKVYKLYFLSDEEIKDGDWVYRDTGTIFQMTKELSEYYESISNTDVHKKYKIIATADKLMLDEQSTFIYGYKAPLPQPSQSFIEHFVEEYNKGNVITEVEVEYEVDWDSKLTNMEFGFIENNMYTEQEIRDSWYTKLKINPDNTINILPKKDSWSREEVIEFARRYAKRCQAPMTDTKWLEENLYNL